MRAGRSYRESDRVSHPGLSLAERSLLRIHEAIPMLEGFSGDYGPMVVRGMTSFNDPDYATSFASLAPAAIPGLDFVRRARDADPQEVTGHWSRRSRVIGNQHKPRIDEKEAEQLRLWLKEKDLLDE